MKLQGLSISLAAALLIGTAQMYLLAFCWTYIAIYSPLPQWAIALGLGGLAFRTALLTIDFMITVLLCLPAACALCKLRPNKLLVYLVVAVLPGVLWQYRTLFWDVTLTQHWTLFVPGFLIALFALPVAAIMMQYVTMPVAPNNSFKPNRFAVRLNSRR